MAGFYEYDNAILGTQTRINGDPVDYQTGYPNGTPWRWTGETSSFFVREESDADIRFHGDGRGDENEQILLSNQIGQANAQTIEIDGTDYQVNWDYSFEVQDPNTDLIYRIAVFDVDFDQSNDISGTTENGYYLAFVGAVPPADTDLEYMGIARNIVSTRHSDIGGERAVCFAAGTRIQTRRGLMPIERLKPGDSVFTREDGFQPLRWIGRATVAATGKCAPVVIRKGTLGNDRDLVVSQQHRLLISDWRAQLLFAQEEVLVRAIDLINGESIFIRRGGHVEYLHLLFDRHQIVFAEGTPAESLFACEATLDILPAASRREILAIFPELLISAGGDGQKAAFSLRRFEGRCLASF